MKFRKLSKRHALEDLHDEAEAHFAKKKTKFTGNVSWLFGAKQTLSITEAQFKKHKPKFKGNETKEEKLKLKNKFYDDIITE